MSTRDPIVFPIGSYGHDTGESVMKRLAIATAAILALLSVTGCTNVGKGKAPPPVVTKG